MKNNIEKLKIGVLGLSENAGTAFVAVYLARMLGEISGLRPALTELKESNLYDTLSLGKHFVERDFFSYFEAVKKGESIRGKKNLLYGVNWACQIPSGAKVSLNHLEQVRLVNNISGNLVISILPSTGEGEEFCGKLWKEFCCLKDMELLVFVVDPLPSSLMAGHDLLCKIRVLNKPVIYLVNKMNRGVSKRELLNYLKVKNIYYLPLIEGEQIYGAEYSSRQLYDIPQVKALLNPCFRDLTKEILDFL